MNKNTNEDIRLKHTIEHKKALLEKATTYFNQLFKSKLPESNEEKQQSQKLGEEALTFFQDLLAHDKVNTELIFTFVMQQLKYDLAVFENLPIMSPVDKAQLELDDQLDNELNRIFNVARENGRLKLSHDEQTFFISGQLKMLATFYKLHEPESRLINWQMDNDALPRLKKDEREKLEIVEGDIDRLMGSLNHVRPFFPLYELGKSIQLKQNGSDMPTNIWAPWRSFDGLLSNSFFILTELKNCTKSALNAFEPHGKGQPANNRARRLGLALRDIFDKRHIEVRNEANSLFMQVLDVISAATGERVESIEHITEWVCKQPRPNSDKHAVAT